MTDQDKTKELLLERKYMARLMAVQALYSQDVLGENRKVWDFDSLNNELISFFHTQARGAETNKKIDKKFFKVLTEGASSKSAELDEALVHHFDDDWAVERIGPLLMSLLRAGAFELIHQGTSARIVMSEYAGLAADFFDETEVSFVNAVLDKVARDIKAEGLSDLQERAPKENRYAKKAPVVVTNPSTKNAIVVDAPKLMLKKVEEVSEEVAEVQAEEAPETVPVEVPADEPEVQAEIEAEDTQELVQKDVLETKPEDKAEEK